MKFGFCFLAQVPLRNLASDTSQMVSQLLFGDVVEVLDKTAENWVLVKNTSDQYEGYMDPKQLLELKIEDVSKFQNAEWTNKTPFLIESDLGNYLLPSACSFIAKEFDVNGINFKISTELISCTEKAISLIPELALSYLNAPYLWGGTSSFGLDCSGFTQRVFKMAGMSIQRDAAQQATHGEVLNFMEEAIPGDLAFFDNEEGDIIHVGIILDDHKIIHASGRVRIDQLDHQGIFNKDLGKYTHKLRLIKRIV